MATVDQLKEQVAALGTQLNTLSKDWVQETIANAERLIGEQNSFTQSLSLISATIASFSLLLLQIDSSVVAVINPKLVLMGFSLLLINVLFNSLALRLWLSIDYEEKAKKLENAKAILEPVSTDVGDKTKETLQKDIDQILGKVSLVMTTETNPKDPTSLGRHISIRNWIVGISLGLLAAGIILIISSFRGVF